MVAWSSGRSGHVDECPHEEYQIHRQGQAAGVDGSLDHQRQQRSATRPDSILLCGRWEVLWKHLCWSDLEGSKWKDVNRIEKKHVFQVQRQHRMKRWYVHTELCLPCTVLLCSRGMSFCQIVFLWTPCWLMMQSACQRLEKTGKSHERVESETEESRLGGVDFFLHWHHRHDSKYDMC